MLRIAVTPFQDAYSQLKPRLNVLFISAHNLHNQVQFPLCLLGRVSLQQEITLATALLLFMRDGKKVVVLRQVGT